MESQLKIKERLYALCSDYIDGRFQTIQNTINEIQESLLSETKSSAGDKHETGRAMLQLEREKAGNQLAEIQKTKEIFSKIHITKNIQTIGLGSVVYALNANYFIAISAGELTVGDEKFYAISSSTPIGKLLIGKKAGDAVRFREQGFVIEKVL